MPHHNETYKPYMMDMTEICDIREYLSPYVYIYAKYIYRSLLFAYNIWQ